MAKKWFPAPAGAEGSSSSRETIFHYLLAAIFGLVVCLMASDSIKVIALILIAAAIAAVFLRFSVLKTRMGAPMLAVALLMFMGGISTLYAAAPKFALAEFLKLAASFCLILLLLAFAPDKGMNPSRRIAVILEGAGALISLLSIDLLSTRILTTPILGFLGLFTDSYRGLTAVEAGVRMVSIVGNPNIFAGATGLCVLLSLALVLTAVKKGERRVHLCLLFLNSLAFLLAFSMGASAAIAVAFVLYLILERKEMRGRLFLLMLETLILVGIAAALISATSFTAWDGFRPIPLVCVIVGAALFCLLDKFVGQRLAEKMQGHGKLTAVLIAVLLVLVIVFLVAALSLTGPATLGAGESVRRASYPAPGDYTLSSVYEGDVTVTIESQNQQDTMMHTGTILYKGSLADASFTVPEDSLVVYFHFYTQNGAALESVRYADTELPLDYKLLPGFIANRLQGLRANENAIQRVVFFEDGLKLFALNPIFGRGLGGFENGIMSVQSFFYETKYAHNHYIQALTDTGIVGLVLFLALLVVSAIALFRARRKEDAHPFTAVLSAALIFMAIHAAVEMVFSAYSYLPFAFGVFALINLCGGDLIPAGWRVKKTWTGVFVVVPAFLFVFALLLGGNLVAATTFQRTPTFNTLKTAIQLDRFERADYMLSYVQSSISSEVPANVQQTAARYALELAELDSNAIPRYLANYYFSLGNEEMAFAMLDKYIRYTASNSVSWEMSFALLQVYESDTQLFREGVARLNAYMLEWDEANIGSITISENARNFIARICG